MSSPTAFISRSNTGRKGGSRRGGRRTRLDLHSLNRLLLIAKVLGK